VLISLASIVGEVKLKLNVSLCERKGVSSSFHSKIFFRFPSFRKKSPTATVGSPPLRFRSELACYSQIFPYVGKENMMKLSHHSTTQRRNFDDKKRNPPHITEHH
jgi:hypothetical protein